MWLWIVYANYSKITESNCLIETSDSTAGCPSAALLLCWLGRWSPNYYDTSQVLVQFQFYPIGCEILKWCLPLQGHGLKRHMDVLHFCYVIVVKIVAGILEPKIEANYTTSSVHVLSDSSMRVIEINFSLCKSVYSGILFF